MVPLKSTQPALSPTILIFLEKKTISSSVYLFVDERHKAIALGFKGLGISYDLAVSETNKIQMHTLKHTHTDHIHLLSLYLHHSCIASPTYL